MKDKRVDLLVSPIEVLGLSIKAENALKRAEITSVMRLIAYEASDLGHKAWDFGPKKRKETETALLSHDFRLGLASDYREQLEALAPGDTKGLRDIAVCFAREFRPLASATEKDKDTLASTLIDPYKGKLMDAFTPKQLQNPAARAEIERHLDLAIETAKAKMSSLKL